MSGVDLDLLNEFVAESNERMADVERQLLDLEAQGSAADPELINTVFRAVHSTKGAAGFLGLETIKDLSHHLENVLNLIRNKELTPNSAIIDTLLESCDCLRSLVNNCDTSNDVDVSRFVNALQRIATERENYGGPDGPAAGAPAAAAAAETAPAPGQEAAPVQEAAQSAAASLQSAETLLAAAVTPPVVAAPATPVAAPVAAAPAPAPAPTPAETKKPAASPAASSWAETSVRVPVAILDRLMNLAGELVLGRNQLLQVIENKDVGNLESAGNRVDQITSELQEAIMHSRMQPVSNLFSKFPRIVRDLGGSLGKQCDLMTEGNEVELDKTIIEAIGDPLTHLIRNSVDHGVERPDERIAAGKSPVGRVCLSASHRAGRVNISISDDGRGIDAAKLKAKAVQKGIITAEQAAAMSEREAVRLIFHAGFSMAEKVTEVSGRGVGMDVVRTNIEKLGGTVDIDTTVGRGTTITVKLPLTLAIIPSLIVGSQGQRFALPQVNIRELVRVKTEEIGQRISKVKGAEVLRLRDTLLPLLRLRTAIGRESAAEAEGRDSQEPVHIIVVETGTLRYGLCVDQLFDSEEIVVKPLGNHFKGCPCLAGATVLGDGCVALILDVASIANHMHVSVPAEDASVEKKSVGLVNEEMQPVMLFTNAPGEQFALPLGLILRLERIRADRIDSVAGQELLQYRGATLPLVRLEKHLRAQPCPADQKHLCVAVFCVNRTEVGLIVPTVVDVREISTKIDSATLREPGILGSVLVGSQVTRLIDVFELARLAHPEWLTDSPETQAPVAAGNRKTRVLLAEDSDFFRKQLKSFLEGAGYEVCDGADGLQAWNLLQSLQEPVDLVVTDIEMPNMDGLEFCRQIRADERFAALPVIAVTSLASEEDQRRGREAGITEYQVKLNRDELLAAIARNVHGAIRAQLTAAR